MKLWMKLSLGTMQTSMSRVCVPRMFILAMLLVMEKKKKRPTNWSCWLHCSGDHSELSRSNQSWIHPRTGWSHSLHCLQVCWAERKDRSLFWKEAGEMTLKFLNPTVLPLLTWFLASPHTLRVSLWVTLLFEIWETGVIKAVNNKAAIVRLAQKAKWIISLIPDAPSDNQ